MRWRVGARRSGAIFGALTGLVFYGFWAMIALGLVGFFSDRNNAANFSAVLSTGLLFVMLYWQAAPVVSAGFGASLDLKKLLAYPISHGKLFTVEVLLRLSTCAEMLIVVAGAAIGLMRNPMYGAAAAPFIVFAALVFIAMNLLLSAGARHLLERLFLRTRLKEFMMLLVFVSAVLPQLLLFTNVRKAGLLRFAPDQVLWPWASIGHVMLREETWTGAVVMLGYLGLAYRFSKWQFERSIRYDAQTRRKAEREVSSTSFAERVFRFPARFLPDPLAAMVEKELRTLARIPRFRLVYAMSCVFGIVVYLPALRNPNPHSFFIANALPFMALYGLLMLGPISYWNAFGFDRSAVEGYFSWPVRFRDALIAKNITVALLLLPQIAVVTLVCRVARVPASAGKFLETVVVILIASLYWFSMGNIWSVRMPRAMDPEKMNQMANKMQALSIWTAPFLLLPLGLAYWARAVFQNEWIFAALLVVAAAVGGVFYKVGLDSAVNTAGSKREAMLLQLSRSEGPLSIA
jgi:ABC-2 type transport system permease protein